MKLVNIEQVKEMVGKKVRAIGNCGIRKDREVVGILQEEMVGGDFVVDDPRGIPCTFNKNTIELVKENTYKLYNGCYWLYIRTQ